MLQVGGRKGVTLVVEGEVVDRCIQQGMIKYIRKLSQCWDESMSDIRFRTKSKVNSPNLSYILRNMEPIGAEFKTV